MKHDVDSEMKVISRLEEFDKNSGSFLERSFFNYRGLVLLFWLMVTLTLGYHATKLKLNASFERMIPTKHPYIANYFKHKEQLAGLGNAIRVVVATTEESIYSKEYLETLREINDEIFFIPGVDRPAMKSLWTPIVRWREVTEEGIIDGPIIPDNYDGSPKTVHQVRMNVERSGTIGKLVANNYKSSVIFVPLLDINPETGKPIDYQKFSDTLEKLREKYRSDTISLHIVGFAKIVGDLMDGLSVISLFFGVATIIATAILFWYTRCVRSTLLVVSCSITAVIWQLGLLNLFGMELDPYSMLVPFLVFSIGMSHGAQKMNGVMQDIGRGTHRYVASRYTFRRLFVPGLTAIISDAVGFSVLIIIQIKVIQQLAISSAMGVFILIFTHLIIVPVCLSYVGVSKKAAEYALKVERADLSGERKNPVFRFLVMFTHRKTAIVTILLFAILAGVGIANRTNLKIGDLDQGAPELRPDARYNVDNKYIVSNYSSSSDLLVIMVETKNNMCNKYENLIKVDALENELLQLPGVESTYSLTQIQKTGLVGFNEGNLRWYELPPNQASLNNIVANSTTIELFSTNCDLLCMYVYLKDHKAETLQSVVEMVETFKVNNDSEEIKFLLAAGNSGIESATNIVVEKSMTQMLYCVYAAVILLCYITFRSWQAVLAAVIPLVLTSILCDSLMVWMRIGVKVATLPVVALGVGIGVDYAIYVMSITLDYLRKGMTLSQSYFRALLFTGKVVILIGVTLALGVATWAFSPIKFQADMGILLAFMFLWNMFGALVLMPAITRFLFREK
jgi:predicted RND superfamily exporter protein